MKGNLRGDRPSRRPSTSSAISRLGLRTPGRAVAAIRDHVEIAEFVTDAGAKEEADWLREKLTKPTPDAKGKTPVQKLLQADRQRTVHLAEVDDDDLRNTLEAAADVAVQIGFYDDKRDHRVSRDGDHLGDLRRSHQRGWEESAGGASSVDRRSAEQLSNTW